MVDDIMKDVYSNIRKIQEEDVSLILKFKTREELEVFFRKYLLEERVNIRLSNIGNMHFHKDGLILSNLAIDTVVPMAQPISGDCQGYIVQESRNEEATDSTTEEEAKPDQEEAPTSRTL